MLLYHCKLLLLLLNRNALLFDSLRICCNASHISDSLLFKFTLTVLHLLYENLSLQVIRLNLANILLVRRLLLIWNLGTSFCLFVGTLFLLSTNWTSLIVVCPRNGILFALWWAISRFDSTTTFIRRSFLRLIFGHLMLCWRYVLLIDGIFLNRLVNKLWTKSMFILLSGYATWSKYLLRASCLRIKLCILRVLLWIILARSLFSHFLLIALHKCCRWRITLVTIGVLYRWELVWLVLYMGVLSVTAFWVSQPS